MRNEVLEIITSEDPEINNRLYISGSGDQNSILVYKKQSDEGDYPVLKAVTEGLSRFRPLHSSELNNRLRNRGFNIRGIKYINSPDSSDSELWCYCGKTYSQIPEINRNSLQQNSFFRCCEYTCNFQERLANEYNDIFGENMTNRGNEIQFYSASMNVVNLIEDVAEVELIKINSDTYTNILNLSELISYNAKPGMSGLVNMTVEYSKGGNIYVRDFSFQAFSYIASEEENALPVLVVENYTSVIEDDVQIEYTNKTIRVNPLNSSIDECIIIRCAVTYGNL